MTDIAANKALVRQFIADIGAGRTDAILAAYAEDAAVYTMGQTLISGRFTKAQAGDAANRIFEVFPNGITFTILEMTAEDDRVAVEATSHASHISGKTYANHYHFFVRLRDGKITEWKEFMDTEMVTDIICGGQRPR